MDLVKLAADYDRDGLDICAVRPWGDLAMIPDPAWNLMGKTVWAAGGVSGDVWRSHLQVLG